MPACFRGRRSTVGSTSPSEFVATSKLLPLKIGGDTLSATVSVGVSLSVDRNQDLAALIMEADRALYRAKANGRNRVEHARPQSVVQLESAKIASA